MITFLTLVSRVSRHALAAEGTPLSMTAPPVATGRKAHVDTAAVCGQAARRAGLWVSGRAQIVQLEEGDAGEDLKEKTEKITAKKSRAGSGVLLPDKKGGV